MNGYELIGLTLMLIASTNLSNDELGLFFRTASVITVYFGFTIAYKNRSNIDNNPVGEFIEKIKSIPSDSMKDYLFGKNRKDPCGKCGNPYHSTDEHKWYH